MIKNILVMFETWGWPANHKVRKLFGMEGYWSWELSDWPVLLYLFLMVIIP